MKLVQRIICAIRGHEWRGAGWEGRVVLEDKMILNFRCCCCGAYTRIMEPMWHTRAINKYHNLHKGKPNKWTGYEESYEKDRLWITKNISIGRLAHIFGTTIEELKKLGYE